MCSNSFPKEGMNVTGIFFHIATGTPSRIPGLKRQRRASRMADSSSLGRPDDCSSLTSPTRPFSGT
ncbi:MAG TPA: hypothetical protein VIL28_16470 [Steroidobacteraceae bacterium]